MTIYAATGADKNQVRRVVGSGDPISGTSDVILIVGRGSVNESAW